jgi:outer membrane cobalamin receptor
VTVFERVEQETPAAITTLGKLDVEKAPGVNLDDRLRLVPGFSLFRRSSSVVANPTTQGVSLRGLGSTGASRTLVLWDGVPLNDPFGGWIYWTRVPAEEVDRVEVVRGATVSVFGDRTMSGSVGLFTRPAEPMRLSLGLEGGNRGTIQPSAGFSHTKNGWGATAFLRAFDTDGYLIVPAERKGLVDTNAAVRFTSGAVKLDYATGTQRASLKADVLAEERANGTPLQRNSTGLGTLSGNYSREWSGGLQLGAVAYHSRQQYHQSFSALAADRNSERLTSWQSVPSQAAGGGAYLRGLRSPVRWTAGLDVQDVSGTSVDYLVPTGQRVGGGSQRQTGLFGQAEGKLAKLQWFAGARAHNAGGAGDFFAPSGGLTYGSGRWRLRSSAYRSFRAPTLNELYREFRAGNTITQANAALRTERLWAAEGGLDFNGEAFTLRMGGFYKEVSDLIANVTLSATATQVVRQRRNAAAARLRGAEIEFEKRLKHFRLEMSYLLADSRFSTRERLPQVPKHQGSAQLSYSRGGTLVTLGLRTSALQFEDDRNTQLLPGFALLQLSARQNLWRGLKATLGMENLADRRILTGFTPFPQTGAPFLVRAGLRWDGKL